MVSPGANIFPHSYNNENECPGVGEYKTTVFAAGCVLQHQGPVPSKTASQRAKRMK